MTKNKKANQDLLVASLLPAAKAIRAAGDSDVALSIFTKYIFPEENIPEGESVFAAESRARFVASVAPGKRGKDWYAITLLAGLGLYYKDMVEDAATFTEKILLEAGFGRNLRDDIKGLYEKKASVYDQMSELGLAMTYAYIHTLPDGSYIGAKEIKEDMTKDSTKELSLLSLIWTLKRRALLERYEGALLARKEKDNVELKTRDPKLLEAEKIITGDLDNKEIARN